MALKKSEIYSTLTKCANKLRSNSGIGAESFKNYVLILLFLKYISDRVKSGERTMMVIPEGCSYDDIISFKGKKDIGEKINEIIAKISEANELQDIINLQDHDFCDKKLGSPEDSSKLIYELVSAFQDSGLDFSQNRAADDDLIGDAYEYLMRNFASQAGKDKGQFYTPTEVSRLMAQLLGIDKDERPNVSAYDPTCGSGSLLLRVKAAAKHHISLDGQDIDPANIELSYLNMVIHGCETADIKVGDTLNKPQHVINGSLRTFDYIVSNPKFSLHNWMNGAKEEDLYGRWGSTIGVPPQQYGDYAFLLHCVRSLKPNGKCAIILPNGVLTRGGEEERIRKWLIEDQHLISGIIAFPANAFFGTSIAGNVIVIDKRRVSDGVFFIDGSNLGYKDADSKIRLREQDIKRVIDVWRAREEVPHFAHLATYERVQKEGEEHPMYEIERNNFALNLSLYVTPEDKEIHQNIDAHLHGGIPCEDVERMQKYWTVCPSLKETLYKPLRPNFVQLNIKKNEIVQTIDTDSSFREQYAIFTDTIEQWCKNIKQQMMAIGKDCDPKALIADWGQSILDTFAACPSLVNAYDVYDVLLKYYGEWLQDDLYMISNDGWNVELNIPAKKSIKWTDLTSDLLPVDIVISHFLPELKQQLTDAELALSSTQEALQQLIEDCEEGEDIAENKEYASLKLQEKKQKANIKSLSSLLLKEIIRVYDELTPELARPIIVEEKWLAAITDGVTKEMETIKHTITSDVMAITNRYEQTLKQLNDTFKEKETAVMNHLKQMGFEL